MDQNGPKPYSPYTELCERVLRQAEKKMEVQFRKLNNRIDALMDLVQRKVDDMGAQNSGSDARIEELNVQMNMLHVTQVAAEYNARARDQNSMVTSKEMLLCPIRNVDTNDDIDCPRTLADLENLRISEVDALLEELGEPIPKTLKEKRERVKWAMGVRTSAYE